MRVRKFSLFRLDTNKVTRPAVIQFIQRWNSEKSQDKPESLFAFAVMAEESGLGSLESLKPAEHQVAGHRFDEGRLGSLVDASGRFYKPLQGGDRGKAESEFYEKISADEDIPPQVKGFFPKYFGVVPVDTTVAGSCEHLVMEDLAHGYRKPCILDIKMGRRTWFEGASQKYIDKCLEKDRSTTSGELGFRIAGMQVFDSEEQVTWKAGRDWCKRIQVSDVNRVLRRFVSANAWDKDEESGGSTPRKEFDVARASQVFGGEHGLLPLLRALKNWFSFQRKYHFYSASILLIYEGLPEDGTDIEGRNASLRLVDFAHVIDAKGERDENFLEAIEAVEKFLNDILKTL